LHARDGHRFFAGVFQKKKMEIIAWSIAYDDSQQRSVDN
jgi:hypothetical protein